VTVGRLKDDCDFSWRSEQMRDMMLPWVFLISVWSCNINDLIRGPWFFTNTQQVVFWNIYGILSLTVIILNYRDERR